MKTSSLSVSVIICAYTEARWHDLVAAVESLHMQSAPPQEIILVVDHNQQLLERAQKQFADVMVIENREAQGLSGARNSGVAIAQADLIAFLDDDATAEPDWLMWFVQSFEDSNVLGVGGTVEPEWLSTQPHWFPHEFYWVVGCTYQDVPATPIVVRNPYGGCACYRREMFERVGGFRTDMGRIGTLPMGCEETELCIRASQYWPQKIFLYEPRAKIHHHIPSARATWRYFRSRCFAEGLSKARVSQYVGAKDGLATERNYIVQMLFRAVTRGMIRGIAHFDRAEFARAGVVIVGLAVTTFGYARGSIIQRFAARKDIHTDVLIQEKQLQLAHVKDRL